MSQPAKEWSEMSQKQRDEITWQASVLAEIRDSKAAFQRPAQRDLWAKLNRRA